MLLTGLTALAEARPPDPLWIAGIYDAADLDEVVEIVLSTPGRVERNPLALMKPIPMIGCTVPVSDGSITPPPPSSAFSIRAPPCPKLPRSATA